MSVSNFELINNNELQMVHEQFANLLKSKKYLDTVKFTEAVKDAAVYWEHNKSRKIADELSIWLNNKEFYILIGQADIIDQTKFLSLRGAINIFKTKFINSCFGCDMKNGLANIFCRLHGIYRDKIPANAMV